MLVSSQHQPSPTEASAAHPLRTHHRIDDLILLYQSYSTDDPSPIRRAYVHTSAKLQQVQSSYRELSLGLETAMVLCELHLDVSSIIAGLCTAFLDLADSIDAKEDIGKKFGLENEVIFKALVSVEKELAAKGADASVAESIALLLAGIRQDMRVIFIVLARRLAKLRLINHFIGRGEQKRYAELTLNVYSLIAHRLGFERLKVEFEDTCFHILQPEKYRQVTEHLNTIRESHKHEITNFQEKMQPILHKAGIHFEYTHRIKHVYSAYKKSILQHKPLDEIYDLSAFRLLVDTVDDCYKSIGLINKVYQSMRGRFKDYINAPKNNGYQSLHATLLAESGFVFELQIRTPEMHEVAEYGFAAHWSYKSSGKKQNATTANQNEEDQIRWFQQLNTELSKASNSKEALEIFRRELSPNSIYVFSPKGKIFNLCLGASVIDYAYAVHSDVGHHCAGAKINGAPAPIHAKLDNGDRVEVLLHKKVLPSHDWLDSAVTNTARSKIRQKLKEESKRQTLALGEKVITNLLEHLHLSPAEFKENPAVIDYFEKKGIKSFSDYCLKIGSDQLPIADIQTALQMQNSPVEVLRDKLNWGRFRRSPRIKLEEHIPTRIAGCCSPVKSDSIVGMTSGSGSIIVHRSDCSTVQAVAEKGRIIELSWEDDLPTEKRFTAVFEFVASMKTLNTVNKVIQREKKNILQASYTIANSQACYEVTFAANAEEGMRIINKANTYKAINAKKKQPDTRAKQRMSAHRWSP